MPVTFDPKRGVYDVHSDLALAGNFDIPTPKGTLSCRPVFALLADLCRRYEPKTAEAITGVDAGAIEATAQLLWESRPVAYYAWSGVEQHTNATQMARAIAQICVLTGSLDVAGGNVLFAGVPANKIDGAELLSEEQRAKALGLSARPLGPSRWEFVTSGEVYDAALDARPYKVRGVVGFGANLVMAHADSARARDALMSLDFMVHADLFMSPTAELADIVLPVASAFETEALRVGFEVSEAAQAHVQLRPRVVPPRGEARSDIEIVFDLANRLGLGDRFFGGDVEAALASPDRAEWHHARGAPRRAAWNPHAGRYASPEVCRDPRRRSRGLRDALAQDRALLGGDARPRLPAASRLRRAASLAALASRPRGAFPARAHLDQGHAFLRDAAPQCPKPPSPRARPAG